jgi:ABC-type multidrug transport system ATPase subunit
LSFSKVASLVPQDDTVHEDLTVRQNLVYNAMLRLPNTMSQQQKMAIVDDVIVILALGHIQDSIVGSVEARGISGGQRKRVNIGVELVADPDVLFLDGNFSIGKHHFLNLVAVEPTSGLDSTASLEIISSLKEIAKLGMNISMVIHQPRYSLFTLIDDVLLLGVGGKTVFFGPTGDALPYFEDFGFLCPPTENPSDFFLDVISGQVSLPENPTFEAKLLPEWWKQYEILPSYLKNVEIEQSGTVKGSVDLQLKGSADSILKSDHLGEMVALESKPPEKKLEEKKTALAGKLVHRASTMGDPDVFEHAKSRAASMVNSVLPTHVQQVRFLFEQLDTNKDGILERPEIILLIKSFIKNLKDSEIERCIEELKLTNDNGLTFEDFIHHLQARTRAPSIPEDLDLAPKEPTQIHSTFLQRRSRVHWGLQLHYFLKRECSKLLGNWKRLVFDLALLGGFGAFIGIVFDSNYDEVTFILISQFATMSVGLLACTASLRWFGAERVNYWREQSAGTSRSAYIVSKIIMQLCEVVFYPLIFCTTFYGLIYPRGRFGQVWGVLILIYWVGSGMGMLFSCILDPQKALLLGVLIPLGFGGFLSGINPTFASMGSFTKVVCGLSFERWGMELFLIVEYQAMDKYLQSLIGVATLFSQGFSADNTMVDVVALLTLGAVFRLVLYPALRFVNRSKQV